MRMEDYRIPNMGKLKALLIKYLEEYREKDDYTYQLTRQSLHGEIKDLKQLLRNINDVSKIVSDLSNPTPTTLPPASWIALPTPVVEPSLHPNNPTHPDVI